jgi:hypothetical protein
VQSTIKSENTPDMVYPLKAINIVEGKRLEKLKFMVTNKEEIN